MKNVDRMNAAGVTMATAELAAQGRKACSLARRDEVQERLLEEAMQTNALLVARDEVRAQILAELIDANKFLRDQNRMIWDLHQAQMPQSSAMASM